MGIGKKTKSQLAITKNKYNADIDILISNKTSNIRFENDILVYSITYVCIYLNLTKKLNSGQSLVLFFLLMFFNIR